MIETSDSCQNGAVIVAHVIFFPQGHARHQAAIKLSQYESFVSSQDLEDGSATLAGACAYLGSWNMYNSHTDPSHQVLVHHALVVQDIVQAIQGILQNTDCVRTRHLKSPGLVSAGENELLIP